MAEQFPEPTSALSSIDELVGQTVDVAEVVVTRDGTPAIITATGKTYLCDNDWASAGATFVQGQLNASGDDYMRVRVVTEHDKAGFRPMEA